MRLGRSYVGSILFGLGLLCVYAGERLVGFGTFRGVFTGLGLVLVLLAIVLRVLRIRSAQGDTRRAETLLLWAYVVGGVALGLYFLQSDLMDKALNGALGAKAAVKVDTALAALWPAVLLASVFPVLLVEFSYASMAMAPVVEYGRIRDALFAGLGLAFALVFAFAFSYVASVRDAKVDLSYFRTAKPGDSTRKIVQGLDEPLDVSLFFPPANEVRGEVMEYFTDLAKESSQLKLHEYDQALDLAKAKELGVSGNGAIVLHRGARREQLLVGLRLEQARTQLRSLDQEIQKRLLGVSKARRTIYLTTGHGERSDDRQLATDQRATIGGLKELLRSQNYELRNLSAAEGLAAEVPGDAAVVAVLGPTSAFLPEELSALHRYVERGGRLMVALDPEVGDFKALLDPYGLKFTPVVLANDQAYVRLKHIIGTVSFSSHPSTSTLSQLASQAPLFVLAAGPLELSRERTANMGIDFTVHAHPATWNDINGNAVLDAPAETRKSWELAAAVTLRKPKDARDAKAKEEEGGRVVVVGDSDLLTDVVLQQPGNLYFALDGFRWLLGDDSIAGQVSSEVDVPIQHTRKQDVFWFYSSIFLGPAVVLGVGYAVTRRKSRTRPGQTDKKEQR